MISHDFDRTKEIKPLQCPISVFCFQKKYKEWLVKSHKKIERELDLVMFFKR